MAGFVEKRNGRYRARFRPRGGKERSETFTRKVDADDWLDRQRGDQVRGQWVDPRAGRITFGRWAAQWQTGQVHHREKTATRFEADLRNHLLPTFEDRPLLSITRTDVQAWIAALVGKGLAPNTVQGCYRLMVQIMKAAADEPIIPRSPCRRINLPEVTAQVTIPTLTQLEVLTGRLPATYRRVVATVAGTGLRFGEAFGLTVDRVDWLRRTVTVACQLQRRPRLQARIDAGAMVPKGSYVAALGSGFFLVAVKRQASNRVIPVGRHTLDVLAAQVAEFPPGPLGLIFANARGRPVSQDVWADAWERATRKRDARAPDRADPCEEHGVRDPGLEPYFTLHDVRHFYASLLIARNLSVKVVAARLGDKDLNVVMNTYLHLWPDDDDRTRDAVDAVLGDQPAASPRPGLSAAP